MEVIVALLACLALGAPLGLATSIMIGRGPDLFVGLFAPDRGLGWPQGVQEEDPPTGWSWRLPGDVESSPSDAAGVSRSTSKPSIERPSATDHDSGSSAVVPVRPIEAHIGRGTSRVHSRW